MDVLGKPPGWVWWCDRALRRKKRTWRLFHWVTPSPRAPSPRAPGKRVRLVHADSEDFPDAPRACGVPTPPCSAFRLLSKPAHSRAWPFAVSGQSDPDCLSAHPEQGWQQLTCCSLRAIRPPGRCGRVRAVRNSPSDVIACQRVVRRRTCSPVTRRSTYASDTSARRVWGQRRSAAPEIALKASRKVRPRPTSAWGGRALSLAQPIARRLRYESPWRLQGACSHFASFLCHFG